MAIKSATDMTKDLNSVFGDLSADLSTALPETIDVNAVKSTTLDGASGVGGGGFVLQLCKNKAVTVPLLRLLRSLKTT